MQHVWSLGEEHTGFWWGDLREGDHLEDPGVDGILKWTFKKWDAGMDWIDMAQDSNRWRALVTIKIELQIKVYILSKTANDDFNVFHVRALYYTNTLCGPQASKNNAVHSQQRILTQL
jgi:hypothetical protein